MRRALCRSWLLALWLVCACNQNLDLLSTLPESDAPEPPASGRDASTPSACVNCAEGTVCAADGCKALPTISAIAAGAEHTCRVSGAYLSCWGANGSAQLGLGDTTNRSQPARVRSNDWLTVAAGAHHTCGLRTPGWIYCFGDNSQGQLGAGFVGNPSPSGAGGMTGGMNQPQRQPRSMIRMSDLPDVVQLKCGGDNCCALTKDNALYCWGANGEGSVGMGRTTSMPVATPTRVAPDSTFMKFFSVGAAHSCAIRTDGALLCWGRNRSGQLGQGSARAPQPTPVQVGTAKDWIRVAAGAEHTCGIRAGKTLWCWGGNDSAQLGIAREGPDATPVILDSPTTVDSSTDWASIAAGAYHTCGIKVSRELRCWGRGDAGQLGLGVVDVQPMPQTVSPPDDWDELALGGAHSCGIDAGGQLYCWGENSLGQLGVGDMRSREEPAALPAF